MKESLNVIEPDCDDPLNLQFCYGINNCNGSVHIIETTDAKDFRVFYTADNNLVMLNGKKQTVFRGHVKIIGKLIKSLKNDYIISCDREEQSCILLWKIQDNFLEPLKKFHFNANLQGKFLDRIIINNHKEKEKEDVKTLTNTEQTNKKEKEKEEGEGEGENKNSEQKNQESKEKEKNKKETQRIGFESIDISFDNRYICALTQDSSYTKPDRASDGYPLRKRKLHHLIFQEVIVFDILAGDNYIVCTNRIFGKEKQYAIRFSKNYEIVTNSSKKLYIFHFDKINHILTHYSPSLYTNTKIYDSFIFTESTFIENSTEIISGTQNGYLIVWDYSSIFLNKKKTTVKQREYQKCLEIRKDICINVVLSLGKYIILGLQDGSVQVLDNELKCYAWFENEHIGSIQSLSFAEHDFTKDFFSWKYFLIYTDRNIMKIMYPNSFNTDFSQNKEKATEPERMTLKGIENEKRKNNTKNNVLNDELKNQNRIILKFRSTNIQCICMNPCCPKSLVYIGNKDGSIEIFDFDENEHVSMIQLKEKEIITMIFSNHGKILCVGCTNGHIYMIQSQNHKIFFSSKDMKHEISFLRFSEDDRIFICASVDGNMIIYKNEEAHDRYNWKYAYKINNNNGFKFNDINIIIDENKLYNYVIMGITNDRNIIYHYYDMVNNAISVDYFCLEQTYIPTAFTFPLYFYNRKVLGICNDGSKLRLYDLNKKEIIKTVHLPFDGHMVQAFIPLHQKLEDPPQTNPEPTKTNKTWQDYANTFLSLAKMETNGLNESYEHRKYRHDFGKDDIFIFILNEQTIVFTITPLYPNSDRYVGAIVCSGEIKEVLTKNGKLFILTDNHILYFHINKEQLKKNIGKQKNNIDTFITQIGGTESYLYKLITNAFYYCEIQKKKQEQRKEKHEIKKVLNLMTLEYIFASLQVFHPKFEIQNILREFFFYYEFAFKRLKETNVPIRERVLIDKKILVSYDYEDDLLLQNIYFIQNEKENNKGNKKNKEKNRLKDFLNYTKNTNTEENPEDQEDREESNEGERKPNNLFNKKRDISNKELEKIYFNVDAFVYIYCNFPVEGKNNIKETIEDILNYYTDKYTQKEISYENFLTMLKRFGENMEKEEFRKIIHIFSDGHDLFKQEDTIKSDTIVNMLHNLKE